jgi:hypothetical protein
MIRGVSDQDQSKILFAKRSPVRFVLVAAPFHSIHMNGMEEDVMEEDLDGEEFWRLEDLAIPVSNNENGQSISVVLYFLSQLIILMGVGSDLRHHTGATEGIAAHQSPDCTSRAQPAPVRLSERWFAHFTTRTSIVRAEPVRQGEPIIRIER